MQQILDRIEIEEIIRRERLARDMQQWEDLAACYNDDSYIDISWFQGSGAEFASAGARMASRLLSFHELGPTIITTSGDRALTDTGMSIHLVAEIGGAEVDCVCFCHSLGRIERKTSKWLIAGHRVIYVHDWIIPVVPQRLPAIDEVRLSRFRKSYRYLSYMLEERGLPTRDDLPGLDRPDMVEALRIGERAWLTGVQASQAR